MLFETRWYLDRRFDRRFNVDTSGRIDLDELSIASPNAEHGVYYEPTSTRVFRFLMRQLSLPGDDWCFVDLGSGKGRTLLMAAEYPFRRVIGVEFARDLHETAMKNASSYRNPAQKCFNLELHHMDAVEYRLPREPSVVFLFNPFERPVMERVAQNIAATVRESGEDMVLIYHNALKRHIFDALGCFPVVRPIALPYDFTREHQRPAVIFATSERLLPGQR